MENELFKDDPKYLEGKENWFIRMYFYCSNGLIIINEFRNLILAILGIYIALKLDNWWYLIAMFIPCIIILTVVGYYVTHKVSKVREWLTIRFGTHFGMKNFDFNEDNNKLLREIRDLLKK